MNAQNQDWDRSLREREVAVREREVRLEGIRIRSETHPLRIHTGSAVAFAAILVTVVQLVISLLADKRDAEESRQQAGQASAIRTTQLEVERHRAEQEDRVNRAKVLLDASQTLGLSEEAAELYSRTVMEMLLLSKPEIDMLHNQVSPTLWSDTSTSLLLPPDLTLTTVLRFGHVRVRAWYGNSLAPESASVLADLDLDWRNRANLEPRIIRLPRPPPGEPNLTVRVDQLAEKGIDVDVGLTLEVTRGGKSNSMPQDIKHGGSGDVESRIFYFGRQ